MSHTPFASIGLSVVLLVGCAAPVEETGNAGGALGPERVVTVSPFPVIRPAGGFGPDVVSTEGHYLEGYTHTYFCEARVTLRTEPNPICTDGMQDCGKTVERVVKSETGRCAAAGERFELAMTILGEGAIGGKNGYREDPLTGSCAAGFVLGRRSSHPLTVEFADAAACTTLEATLRTGGPLTLDLAVKTPSVVTLVGTRS
ncbi:MAG TPA: hypothetical protein PLR99_20830 [Polyangiaceae bacterium]|jgi:hypothetical protein|nr:hypothetical protein [Polyangiaceae bacterium]